MHYHRPKQSKNNDQDIIFGVFPVLEALRSGADVDKVLIQQGLKSPQLQEMKDLMRDAELPVQFVPKEKLDRVTKANHQGVIGFISPVSFAPIEEVLQRVF